jgi:uncharacterized YigZ family protein
MPPAICPMNIIKSIRTIEGFSESRIKEKSSVFIGQSYFMINSDDCNTKLNEIRKEFYDATHHCYCYRLNSGETKYSDNGEPSGTAGIRILNAIEHFELTDIMVVVIRYFGGTKLGVGPLGKAYYESAHNVLKNSPIIVKDPYQKISISTNFDKMGHVFRLLTTFSGKKITSDYKEDSVEIGSFLNSNDIASFMDQIKEHSQGDIEIKISGEIIYL